MKKSFAYSGLFLILVAVIGLAWNAVDSSAQQSQQRTAKVCAIGTYNTDNCKRAWDAMDKDGLCDENEEPTGVSCSTVGNAPRCENGSGDQGQECVCSYTCKKKQTLEWVAH